MSSLFVFLLVVAAGGAIALPTTDVTDPQSAEKSFDATQSGNLGELNGTVIRISLDSEGNADWEITGTFDIETDAEEAAFETLAAEFERGDVPELGYPEIRDAVERVNDQTDRSMAISEPERTNAVEGSGENRTGQLSLSFAWENFASVDGDRIRIDDSVLLTERGMWFRGLTADQELIVRPPEGYGVDDASVAPDAGGELRWTGRVDFDETALRATFIGTNGNDTDQTNGNGTDNTDDTSLLPLLVGGIILVVLVVALAVAARRTDLDAVAEELLADTESTEQESEPESQPVPEEEPAEDDEDEEEIDVELLSDEERVERLLDSNGGRMKQANIVKETGWSNAKVSQLLSSMEEQGRIDKLRIGRENLISFPDQDVADISDDE